MCLEVGVSKASLIQASFIIFNQLTAVSIPVKVFLGIAVALVVETVLLAGWAVRKRNMVVCNVVEEVNLVLVQHETSCNGMDGSIAPAFVEETASVVERCEKVNIGIRAEPVEVADFKVGPLLLLALLLRQQKKNDRHTK